MMIKNKINSIDDDVELGSNEEKLKKRVLGSAEGRRRRMENDDKYKKTIIYIFIFIFFKRSNNLIPRPPTSSSSGRRPQTANSTITLNVDSLDALNEERLAKLSSLTGQMDNHFSKSQEGDIILSFLHHGEDKRKVKSREMVAASSYKEI